MHLYRVSLIGAFVALALVSSARGDSVVSPKGNQTGAQQRKDDYECRRWAAQHTARKKQREQDDANLETRRANYDRAVKTCLEGRNYSVN